MGVLQYKIKQMLGFKSCEEITKTICRIEIMHMTRAGQRELI